jgi:hypothetical protein
LYINSNAKKAVFAVKNPVVNGVKAANVKNLFWNFNSFLNFQKI